MRPETKVRTLATKLLSLADKVAQQKVDGDLRGALQAERQLQAFNRGLSKDDRQAVLEFLNAHLPADSASEILLGLSA